MENSAARSVQIPDASISSNQKQRGENLRVQRLQHPAGEGTCQYTAEHTLSMSLLHRPIRLLHTQAGKTYTGLYGKGDMVITPATMPLFAQWDDDDHYVQIRIAAHFLQQVAAESLDQDADRLELLPEFRTRSPQIEAIAMMLLAELEQGNLGNQLYIDSLANVLAVNVLRHYTVTKPQVPIYEGGLPPKQLQTVIEYVDTHLEQDLKLAELAALVDISQFHFSRLFKQSLGLSPYQYLLQQRVERAKQLLKQTDQPIIDIAFACRFNSHSHLSKQFRQITGMTPKAYRVC